MKGLKIIRTRLGISQSDLEKMTGIDANTFSRYERGVVIPSVETAQKIATALNVSVDELLNGPVRQEFEVKILMGVKNLSNMAGIEISNNAFFFGIDDNEPQIHLGGKVVIGTLEERKEAAEKILKKFWEACWMYDHKDEAEAEAPDLGAIQPA
ncbi:MAG: helix-turn-helix transcriptional regulator [Synergistaceae bacterium]|nr:helix-turn-helix transcriptional regulator [Synergistaceae bacterium]